MIVYSIWDIILILIILFIIMLSVLKIIIEEVSKIFKKIVMNVNIMIYMMCVVVVMGAGINVF